MLSESQVKEMCERILEKAKALSPRLGLVHLTAQTPDNQDSVLNWARDTQYEGPLSLIGYNGSEYGYPGHDAWVAGLVKRGVKRERIKALDGARVYNAGTGKYDMHTLTEMSSMVRFANHNDLRHVGVVAPEFHLFRAYMTAVGIRDKLGLSMYLYPILGTDLPWDEVVIHSQGTTSGTRRDLLAGEMKRIFAYHEQGNLPHTDAVMRQLALLPS